MRNLFFLLLLLTAFSCGKDADNELHYDGPNQTGPILSAGYHELAVRFPADMLDKYQGRSLESIRFFMGLAPQKVEVKIYGQGTDIQPGTLLYSATVTGSVRTPEWNRHDLASPIELTGEDIWVSIALTHAVQQQSLGCDAGPNQPDGDWTFEAIDGQWRPYLNRTGESINWNIRAYVSEE